VGRTDDPAVGRWYELPWLVGGLEGREDSCELPVSGESEPDRCITLETGPEPAGVDEIEKEVRRNPARP